MQDNDETILEINTKDQEQFEKLLNDFRSEKQKITVALDAFNKILTVLNSEPKSYGMLVQRRQDRADIAEIVRTTLLIIK